MRICKVDGCSRKHYAKGYCARHYKQNKKYGRVFGNPRRTYRDPNEFVIDSDICKIFLYDVWGVKIAEAIIDDEDITKVNNNKWYLDGRGYVTSKIGGKHSKLSRVIMGLSVSDDLKTDHRDHDPLNNRKSNLRSCTQAENAQNSIMPKSNTSGYKGIWFCKQTKRWAAMITVNYKRKWLGRFDNKIHAVLAYDKAARKYHGEFACLNFPKDTQENNYGT